MKFLANENFPSPSFKYLKSKGWDIIHIGEEFMGFSDKEVLDLANKENRIIITFDRDYGKLVFRDGYKTPGIIYFRIRKFTPLEPGIQLGNLLNEEKIAVNNLFTIIGSNMIRQRAIK